MEKSSEETVVLYHIIRNTSKWNSNLLAKIVQVLGRCPIWNKPVVKDKFPIEQPILTHLDYFGPDVEEETNAFVVGLCNDVSTKVFEHQLGIYSVLGFFTTPSQMFRTKRTNFCAKRRSCILIEVLDDIWITGH